MEGVRNTPLVIRADADARIGTGHLMRCLALGQAWRDGGGRVCFVTHCRGGGLLRRLRAEEFDVHELERPHPEAGDWCSTREVLGRYPGAWMVLDGYHFDEGYQQGVKERGNRLLVIDDVGHLAHYHADIVLNQNVNAEQVAYSGEPHTILLLGTRYVLLRREFLSWVDREREIPNVARRVLVTLGGGDPNNYTLEVIEILQSMAAPGMEAAVVLGASNPHGESIQEAVKSSRFPMRLLSDVEDMPGLMAWSDVAVSAAGTTIWELMFMGTPTVAVVLAHNQRSNGQGLESRGLARVVEVLGAGSFRGLEVELSSLIDDLHARESISANARRLVDGRGVARLVAWMNREANAELRLRPAAIADCRSIWEWANDPVVREASFRTEPIPWEEHARWYEARLGDPRCWFFVVVDGFGVPVGSVRFDSRGNEAEVSVAMAAHARGLGLGSKAIRLASADVFRTESVIVIRARIKEDNTGSIRAFGKAGYRRIRTDEVGGVKAVEMAMERGDVSP